MNAEHAQTEERAGEAEHNDYDYVIYVNPGRVNLPDHNQPWEARRLTLRVKANDSIEAVKAKVRMEGGYPVGRQTLTWAAGGDPRLGLQVLENGPTLQDYDIQSEDVLHLYERAGEPMTIYAKLVSGAVVGHKLELTSLDTVDEVKRKIECDSGIPVERQKLLLRGRELFEGWAALEHHGVRNKDTLILEITEPEQLKDASLNSALGYTPAFGRHYSKMETLRGTLKSYLGRLNT